MTFSKGEGRNQLVCLPRCIEDYIAEINPVKVIYAFVCVMGKRAKALLGVESMEILADKGYYVGSDIRVDHVYISRPENPNECEEKRLKLRTLFMIVKWIAMFVPLELSDVQKCF